MHPSVMLSDRMPLTISLKISATDAFSAEGVVGPRRRKTSPVIVSVGGVSDVGLLSSHTVCPSHGAQSMVRLRPCSLGLVTDNLPAVLFAQKPELGMARLL